MSGAKQEPALELEWFRFRLPVGAQEMSTPSASEGIVHETLNDELISHGLARIRVDWNKAYARSVPGVYPPPICGRMKVA